MTIETKIAKNGAILVNIDGKRAKFADATAEIQRTSIYGGEVTIVANGNAYIGGYNYDKSEYIFTDDNGNEYIFIWPDLALKEFARGKIGENIIVKAAVEADNDDDTEVDTEDDSEEINNDEEYTEDELQTGIEDAKKTIETHEDSVTVACAKYNIALSQLDLAKKEQHKADRAWDKLPYGVAQEINDAAIARCEAADAAVAAAEANMKVVEAEYYAAIQKREDERSAAYIAAHKLENEDDDKSFGTSLETVSFDENPADTEADTKDETATELPTGNVTVDSGAAAWSLVGEYFLNSLKFTGYEKGFNREDTFYYTNDKTLYAVATCTPDNSRVECVEVVDTNASGSKRKPLTVYIKPAPVEERTDNEPTDDFSAKLAAFDGEITEAEKARDIAKAAYEKADAEAQNAIAARQEFLDNVAGELTRKLQAACVNNDFIQTVTIHGRLYTIGDFGNVYVDPTVNGGFAFVTYDNRTLARYDTPAQIEAVIDRIKTTIDRKEAVFYFPTKFEAKLDADYAAFMQNQPPEVKELNAQLAQSTLQGNARVKEFYDDGTLYRSYCRPCKLSAVRIEYDADTEGEKGYTLRYFDKPLELYNTFAQVKTAIEQFKTAIESGATEFTFPTIDELVNPVATNSLATIAETCAAINTAAPEDWEIYFDSETKAYIVSYAGRTVTTLRNLNSARDLAPEDFFYQFMEFDNDCKPVYWGDDKPPEFEPCAPVSFYADIEYDENGEIIPWF